MTPDFPAIPSVTGGPIWLQVGTLLDGVNTKPIENAHVVYDASEILYVGAAEKSPPRHLLKPEQTKPDLALPGFTVLPGLIEAHAHMFLEGGELDLEKRKKHLQKSQTELSRLAVARLRKLVKLGIVAIRDAGDKHGVGLMLSKLYQSQDKPLMPYIDSPGAAIHRAGRYGSFMSEPIENDGSLRECVARRVRGGSHRIKLIVTGIIDFKSGAVKQPPQMRSDEVAVLVRTAKAFGRQTFAHASGDAGIDQAIDGMVDSVEHGFFVREDQLARMRDRHIAWAPTFVPVHKQIVYAGRMSWDDRTISNLHRILEQHAASLLKAHQMGVTVIAGSDAGSYGVAHGLGLLDEMELMEQAGLPALVVLNSATGVSSGRLGYSEKVGRIHPGYRSRFILTRHSPLAGVSNLRKPKFLIFDGQFHQSGDDLDAVGM